MTRGWRARWQTLWRDRRAMALVELAIVGPLFLMSVLAMFQLAYLFVVQQVLENATNVAGRAIETGNAQGSSLTSGIATSQAFVQHVVCPAMLFLPCATGYVFANVQTLPSGSDYFSLAGFQVPTSTASGLTTVSTGGLSFCNGQAGQYMQLNVVYLAPVWLLGKLPLIGTLFASTISYNGSTTIPLYASAAFADEEFTLPNSETGTGTGACS